MTTVETEDRIRDAAIAAFADDGFAASTVRAIAARAQVSPGLVMHYFGSKEGLRAACDRHVADVIREQKERGAGQGSALDPMAAFRDAVNGPPLARYLVRAFAEGSPGSAELFDQLVDDAAGYMATMVDNGVMRPGDDLYGRAAVLTTWSIGALILHEHLERLLGVDLLTMPDDPTAGAAYIAPVLDILGDGVLAPEVVASFKAAFSPGNGEPTTKGTA